MLVFEVRLERLGDNMGLLDLTIPAPAFDPDLVQVIHQRWGQVEGDHNPLFGWHRVMGRRGSSWCS